MNLSISNDKLSAIISLAVAILILIANFFQWWNITYNGKMITKFWVKSIFVVLILVLVFAIFLIII